MQSVLKELNFCMPEPNLAMSTDAKRELFGTLNSVHLDAMESIVYTRLLNELRTA